MIRVIEENNAFGMRSGKYQCPKCNFMLTWPLIRTMSPLHCFSCGRIIPDLTKLTSDVNYRVEYGLTPTGIITA